MTDPCDNCKRPWCYDCPYQENEDETKRKQEAQHMTLTDQEYNFLMELSARTKMDCWFWIETDDDGNDFVLDLENDEALPLHEGIAQLFDGVIEDDINDFNAEELMLWNSINDKIKREEIDND